MVCRRRDITTLLQTACCLGVVGVALGTPATVTLGNLEQPYDGSPKIPSISTQPAGLPCQLVFRNCSPDAPAPVSEVIYNDTPAGLDPSYMSYAFSAQNLSALGNFIEFGGSARRLQSCETILVTWATAADWPELAAANPAGYYHPLKISLYELSSAKQLKFLAEASHAVFVPWRPLTMPDGQPYRYNGHAFRALVPFPDGITLPERVMAMVSFNTQNTGFNPTGVPGPYNTLNVAIESATVSCGNDLNPDAVLQVKSDVWYYPSTGWQGMSAPMFRIHALSTDSTTAPVRAGLWNATARISDPEYAAKASAEMRIGERFGSWIAPMLQAGAIDPAAAGDDGDPDRDSVSNLMEYACGLDPSTANHNLPGMGLPQFEVTAGGFSILYRRNLAAGDLEFTVETTTRPEHSHSWIPAATHDTTVATDGTVRTIRATLAPVVGEARRFMRLKVVRR